MGDPGAHFLGLMVALLALALPIADTALAIVRRHRHGQSIAHADTRHLHHRLLELGLTQREICLLFACCTGILGAMGLTVFGHRRILAVAIVLLIVVLSTVLGERLRNSHRRIPVPFYWVVRLLLEGRGLR